jgi:uncharacterized repeat protein (TIGR03803 family)
MLRVRSAYKGIAWFSVCTLLLTISGALPATAGKFAIVHKSCSRAFCSDGGYPRATLIADSAGNIYGTTAFGGKLAGNCGNGGCGVVFRITPDGKEHVVHSFNGGSKDGTNPNGGLVADQAGNFYGTTQFGGANDVGTVFKIASDGSYAVLHSFDGTDGSQPGGSLIVDGNGIIYGTTSEGGTGEGNIFEIAPDGTTTSLYAFCEQAGCSDGADPATAGVVMYGNGNLYGTTYEGGSGESCADPQGCGVVYELSANGNYNVLYSFCAESKCADGWAPIGPLLLGKMGVLYGTTNVGGSTACGNGCGTVFSLTPSGTESVLVAFDGSNGQDPYSGVIAGDNGTLYGTAFTGGDAKSGTIFEFTQKRGLHVLQSLQSTASWPLAGLLLYKNVLYGTTTGGGNVNRDLCTWDSGPCGTLFRLKL